MIAPPLLWLATISTAIAPQGGAAAAPSPVHLAAPPPAETPVTTTWIVKGPPNRLVLTRNRETTLSVKVTGDRALHHLRLAFAVLQDAGTSALLRPPWIKLCQVGVAVCRPPGTIEPRAWQQVALRIDDDFTTPGTYTGTVFLTADEGSDTPSFDLTVLSSTNALKWIGTLLILAGVLFSVGMIVVVRQRLMRAEALLPAMALRDVLLRLRDTITRARGTTGAPAAMKDSLARLDEQAGMLTAASLEAKGFIPRKVLSPTRPAADTTAEYRQFLEAAGVTVSVLSVVVGRGLTAAVSRWEESDQNHDAVGLALVQLDTAGAKSETVQAARDEVTRIITAIDTHPVVARALVASGKVRRPPAEPSARELSVHLQRLSGFVWILWALLSCGAGWGALIARNDAFGTAVDLVACFFWGVGVQAAGQGLQQVTPSSVATTLHIAMPT
jgi:hypothetical protein